MDCLNNDQLNACLRASPDLELLEHMAQCELCATRLAEHTLALPVLVPPAGLQNEVMQKIRTKAAATIKRPESLGSYAMRVLVAVAAVLVLLFSGTFDRLAALPQDLPKIKEQLEIIFTKEDSLDASKTQ